MSRPATALFPGAFQPPHGAHLAAVHYLASRADVGEVVVVITNRNRGIPGTTLSLDARLSQRIWQIYLEGTERVRTEIAPHTAVAHALDYLGRAPSGSRLIYCIGEQDLADGDSRFDDLPRQGRERGIDVEVVAAPTAGILVRATALRRCIARGESGREEFISGLPDTLSDDQRARVWARCREGVREVCDLARERLESRLTEAGIGEIGDITCVDRSRIDPVFRLAMADGRRLLARYAGDAEGDDGGHGMARKPRRALKVERRALAALREHAALGVELAGEIWFERRKGVLVMDELLPDGESLADALVTARSIAPAMAQLGRFLAGCHRLQPTHLRNSDDEDRTHWSQRSRELGAAVASLPAFATLLARSEAAAGNALCWLHAVATAVRIDGDRLGVVDFEHAASWGDPALDLGMLSGDCLAIAIAHRCEALALAGIEALWASYDADRLPRDPGMAGRAAGWAAVGCGRRLAALGRACPAGVDRLWALAADGRQQAATAAESIAALRSIAA